MSNFIAKSESNDFELMDISDKANAIIEDAINCPLEDGELTFKINNNELEEKIVAIQDLLLFNSETIGDIKNNIKSLVKIAKDAAIKNYQVVSYLMKPAINKKISKFNLDIKDIVSEFILTTSKEDSLIINNGASANMIYQQPQLQQPPLQQQGGINANDIISNINNSIYSPLDNAVKWLNDNVKFGCKIDTEGVKVSNQEAINLYNIFNYQPVVMNIANYHPIKDGNKRIWFRLEDYDFDKNIYKYAFGALSSVPGIKRIIFLCNTNTGAYTVIPEYQ